MNYCNRKGTHQSYSGTAVAAAFAAAGGANQRVVEVIAEPLGTADPKSPSHHLLKP